MMFSTHCLSCVKVNTFFSARDNLRTDTGLDQKKLMTQILLPLALEKRDFQGAIDMQVNMLTKAYDNHGQWLVGLKRLIDLDQKIAK